MGGQQFPINLSGVLVAAMLVLAALLNQPPLRSDRPPAARIPAEPSGPFQDIPARIWEDPLEAVARRMRTSTEAVEPVAAAAPAGVGTPAADASATGSTSALPADPPDNILKQYLRHLPEPGRASRLLIMPVMISGAPHPELREQRLRMRFAVGYGRFYQLQTTQTKPIAGESATAIHPGPSRIGVRDLLVSHAGSLVLAILLALAALLLATNWQPRRRAPTQTMAAWAEARAEWLLTLCYLLVGGGWLAWAIGQGEEPFTWFGGVSIWPSEIIRLFAGWVAGLCLIYGWRRVRDAERRIAGVFDLPVPGPGGQPPRERFRAWCRGRPPLSLPPPNQGQVASVDDRPPDGAGPDDPAPGPPGVRPLAERICRLFTNSLANNGEAADQAAPPTPNPPTPTIDAAAEWLLYLPQASAPGWSMT